MRVAWGSHVGGSLMLAAPKLMARNKPWGGLRVALEWLRGGPSAGRQMGEQSDQEAADGPRQADASLCHSQGPFRYGWGCEPSLASWRPSTWAKASSTVRIWRAFSAPNRRTNFTA